MRTLNITGLLLMYVLMASSGCGGSAAEANDGGTSGVGGNGTGGATSASCDVITTTAAQVGLCQAASICAQTECKPALAACMGDNYQSGIYAGKECSDYANCVKACNCDSTCANANCALSTVCGDCLNVQLLPAVMQSEHCAAIAFRCING